MSKDKNKKIGIYYQIDSLVVEDDNSVELIKQMRKSKEIGIENGELIGVYKQTICKIRKDLQIKNAMSLGVVIHKITKKEYLNITIYDYELPNADWNCWVTNKYDEDKKIRYVEITEV